MKEIRYNAKKLSFRFVRQVVRTVV